MKKKLLILLFLASFSTYAQTNLISNGDFENWTSSSQPDNWFRYLSGFVSQSTSAQNGTSSANMMIVDGAFNYINGEYFPVVANKTYRITLYHKLVSGSFSTIDLSLYHKPSTFKEELTKTTDATFSNSEWRKIEFDYTPTVSENIEVDIWTTGTLNSEILVDNVSVIDVAELNQTYTLIPDLNFENKLISLGIDSGVADGKVLTSNVDKLTALDISSSSISDLTGIQDFVALTNLDCSRNQLTTLNISKNIALNYLHCHFNQLTTLDISKNVTLTDFDCSYNQLTYLDVSNNLDLNSFSCASNKLNSLDVSKNVALTYFICHTNQLTTIDVSKNIALTTFVCGQNQLTALDISNNLTLSDLSCNENQLTNLDVSKNLALVSFHCSTNQLTSIDVSKNIALDTFSCRENQLTTLDVSQNVTLTFLHSANNQLTNLDVSKNVALTYLNCSSNNLLNLNLKNGKNTLFTNDHITLSGNPNLTCIQVDDVIYSNANWSSIKDNTANFNTDCNAYTLIPDLNFENVLIEQGIDSGTPDGKVLTSNIALITTLDVSNKSIVDLTGIQDFTAITALYCYSNQLTSLDLSRNINLTYLNCGSNRLTSLNVLSNNKLTDLFCYGNQLTNLDVSNNLNLINLYCYSNLLTSLDITNNVNLTSLMCNNNSLSSLNLKTGNNLALITSNLNFTTNPNLSCIQVDDENYSNLNWNSTKDAIADFSTNCNTYTFIPDINFENALIEKGFDSGAPDGKIQTSNIATIKTLDISSKSITDLTGIEAFKGLENLFCYSNQLTTLDLSKNINLILLNSTSNQLSSLNVSKNVNLTGLFCNLNQLKALDVSNNINLKDLICSSNRLTSLDLSKNINLYQLSCETNQISNLDVTNNINLAFLGCHDNQITSLDVSKNLNLTDFILNANQVTSLDVSNNVNLTNLSCGSNQLTSLDVSKNVNLKNLVCDSNQLTSLDVSNNANLKYLYSYSNQLTALDLNNNVLLETLIAFSNQITTLDLSKNSNLSLVYLDNNPLSYLNIQNGNNQNFILPSTTNKKNTIAFYTSFLTSGTLSCIQVDDPIYSNANWSSIKDNTANFNTDCATSNLYTYIPDVNFENKLIALGIDLGVADGKVLTSSILSLTSLDVSSSSISDLTGIQDFVALTNLNCSQNELTTLNISKNLALISLECSNNKLSALDVSKNLSLESLRCEVNYITSLDVSNNLSLGALFCYTNLLSDLDVSKNLLLTTLYFDNNKISTIDVSKNTVLGALSYSGNNVTTIDVSKNSSLGFLNCQSNQVTNLDVSNNLILNSLFCNDNQITSLDISKNNSVVFLLCQNNKLLNLNLKNNGNKALFDTSFLNFTGNPNLTCIQVDDETYSNTNWSNLKDITASYSANCSPYTLIPDTNFEQKLIDLGIDTDGLNGKVDRSRINTLTSLDVSESGITSLMGIEDFVALNSLNCSSNQLSVLDISKNTALGTLYCSSNQLTTLDLSNNISLWSLHCDSNQLAALDVSANTALTDLICSSNQLTSLDISNQKALWYLACSSNQLTTLDISQNTALWSLSCDSNQLTALDISANTAIEALYCFSNQLTSLDVNNQTKLTYLDCSSNQLIALDVSKNTALWNFSCNSNQLTYLNLKNGNNSTFNTISFINNPNLTCILVDDVAYSNTNWAGAKDSTASYSENCNPNIAIPDSSFEQKLIDLGIDTDGLNGKITIANINSITTLDLSNCNIKDLTGIENFTALNILNCGNNQLITLDLSKNPNLQILHVTGNPLVYLNLKNGNNQNLIVQSQTAKNTSNTQGTSFLGLTSLGCVKVDSADYSNTNWSKIKETTTIYSETCTLGLEDSVFDKVAIYPNPTQGELHIDNIVLEKATVYDALGKLVKTTTFTSGANDNTMHLEGFSSGIYYIYLESEGANTAKKIIVK